MIARVLLVVRDRLAVRWHRAHVMGDFADRSRHEALIDAIDDFLDGHAPTGASNPGTSEGNGARESRRKLGCWQAGTGFETQAGLRYGPLARGATAKASRVRRREGVMRRAGSTARRWP